MPISAWPKFGLWWDYSLSKAAIFLQPVWELKAHVLVLGPFAFCVLWRKSAPLGVWVQPQMPSIASVRRQLGILHEIGASPKVIRIAEEVLAELMAADVAQGGEERG